MVFPHMREIVYRASDIMKEPITVSKNTKIREAIARIINEGIGAIVVVDDSDKPIGIVTKRDLLWAIIYSGKNIEEDTVDSIMSKQLITIDPDTELTDIVSIMTRNNISHLPVVEDGRLVGIISDRDLIEALNDILNMFRAEEIRATGE